MLNVGFGLSIRDICLLRLAVDGLHINSDPSEANRPGTIHAVASGDKDVE